MTEYCKIQTVFKRNPETNFKRLIEGVFSTPEFEYLKNNEWTFTEKVDGTNIRIIFNDSKVSFAGKTDKAEIPKKLLEYLHKKFDVCAFTGGEGICLYGEGYGEKIQSGNKYNSNQEFVLFDVKISHWWLEREAVIDIGNQLDIAVVPVIGSGTLYEMVEIARSGFKSHWGDFIAEGIVARPATELFDRSGRRLITKIKYKDFK